MAQRTEGTHLKEVQATGDTRAGPDSPSARSSYLASRCGLGRGGTGKAGGQDAVVTNPIGRHGVL